MPYKLSPDGLTVHKENSDGTLGEAVPGGAHKTHAEALAHMRALYANVEGSMPELTFSLVAPADLEASIQTLAAQERSARLLYFKNAVLARAETNANKDNIDDDGLNQVASTLPMTAIDLEHRRKQIVGFYTAARVADHALYCDGVIFADRFPDEAKGVQDGTYRLSIEAKAENAICSMCNSVFESAQDYCAHLSSQLTSGATRLMRGLTAKGGAITKIPAGTNTGFDPRQIELVASLNEPTEKVKTLTFLNEAEYSWFLLTGKVLSTDERKSMKDEQFGVIQKKPSKKTPGKNLRVRRFPMPDLEHARKALQLLPKAKDLSDEEKAAITKKAKAMLGKGKHMQAFKLEAAARAAQFLMATVNGDTLGPNPSGTYQLYSPVVAPHYYFPPYPAWVDKVASQSSPATPTQAMTASDIAAALPPAVTPEKLEEAKREIMARLDTLDQTIKAAQPQGDKPKEKPLGVMGLEFQGASKSNGNSAVKPKVIWAKPKA